MKRTGFYHIFPFQEVEKGQSVVIYGMGEVGHHYEEQIRASRYCTLEFMTDCEYLRRAGDFPYAQVRPLSALQDTAERIVVAIGDEKMAEEAISQLVHSWKVPRERILWRDAIVGADMVVDDQILDINRAGQVKRRGYYHLFPFSCIEPHKKIIVWGMGEVGRNYQAQLERTKYCEIIGAVDKNAKNIKAASIDILPPEQIRTFGEDAYVVIANGDAGTAREIQESLSDLGVSEERIVYEDAVIATPLVVAESASTNHVAPYLAGSESEKARRTPPMTFAMRLFEYDIVSFDVFDTLILRPFAKPTDLFLILAERLQFLEFPQVRMRAEQKAREWSRYTRRTAEVSFEEIYRFFERETGLDAQACMEMEFATEREFCFANPYMLEVYRILRAQGMKIVFTSDMYLGRARIKELLLSCGYDGVSEEDIFVSCDYSCGKGGEDAGLFGVVRNIMGRQHRYVHIGDHFQNDVVHPRRRGFASIHYPGVNAMGNPHRATFDGMSDLVGSAYGGIVNAHLHQGLHSYSVPYEYGFVYGGLYVLGYASWIERFAEEHGIDKVLFLARDGDIYRQVFDMLPVHVSHAYALYSRLPACRLEAGRNRHFYLDRLLRRRLTDFYPMTVQEWMELCHIEPLAPLLSSYPIDLRQDMDNNTVGILEGFLIDHWHEVLACYEEEQQAACAYFKELIGDARRVAIVDIGWIGSGPLSLRYLIEQKWKLGVEVECLVAGAVVGDATKVSPLVASGALHSYMFSREMNRNLYDSHLSGILTNAPAIELLTQSMTPTFDGFSLQQGHVRFHYGIPEVENKSVIREIQQGILDFARIYLYMFRHAPEMLHISGYDAYIPFRMLSKHATYFSKFFGSYAICLSIGSNPRTAHIETLREIFARNAHR